MEIKESKKIKSIMVTYEDDTVENMTIPESNSALVAQCGKGFGTEITASNMDIDGSLNIAVSILKDVISVTNLPLEVVLGSILKVEEERRLNDEQ